MTPLDVLGAAAGVLALVGLIAVVVARWRTTSDETITKLLRDERDLYRDKADRLDKQIAALEMRVQALEQENRTLRALHDSRAEMAKIRHAMTEGFTTLSTIMKEGK
jgi:Tfp pilus assembly protein PilN